MFLNQPLGQAQQQAGNMAHMGIGIQARVQDMLHTTASAGSNALLLSTQHSNAHRSCARSVM
jgi:hypothetical protein